MDFEDKERIGRQKRKKKCEKENKIRAAPILIYLVLLHFQKHYLSSQPRNHEILLALHLPPLMQPLYN